MCGPAGDGSRQLSGLTVAIDNNGTVCDVPHYISNTLGTTQKFWVVPKVCETSINNKIKYGTNIILSVCFLLPLLVGICP